MDLSFYHTSFLVMKIGDTSVNSEVTKTKRHRGIMIRY